MGARQERESGAGGDFVAFELQRVLKPPGEIPGKRSGPMVLDRAFVRFYVGKHGGCWPCVEVIDWVSGGSLRAAVSGSWQECRGAIDWPGSRLVSFYLELET